MVDFVMVIHQSKPVCVLLAFLVKTAELVIISMFRLHLLKKYHAQSLFQ